MKALTTLALVAAIATLSGCVVAPRGEYRDRDHAYDHRYGERDHYYRYDNGRRQDGDHAGGTRTPD